MAINTKEELLEKVRQAAGNKKYNGNIGEVTSSAGIDSNVQNISRKNLSVSPSVLKQVLEGQKGKNVQQEAKEVSSKSR